MQSEFEKIVGRENVRINEPMKLHTTFRIGGCADYFLTPENAEQLSALIKLLKKEDMPYLILGNGSNLLVGDKGIRGAVISTLKKADSVTVDGEMLTAQSGALLSKTAAEALRAELAGLEFASGIPGSVGGGVFMNAGAYGSELSEVIDSVSYIDKDGEIHSISVSECGFGYRKSIFEKEGLIVTSAAFRLKKDNPGEIRARMNDFTERRVSKQPLTMPSAGSTFKRPEGNFAGALIEQANLKGKRVGGAQVSEKHAGFIVNTGDATAKDVLCLIEYVKETVYDRFGVMLEPEVRLVGEF